MKKQPLFWVASSGGGGGVHRVHGQVAAVRLAKKLAKSICRAVEIMGEGGKYQKMAIPPKSCSRGRFSPSAGRIVDN